MPAAPFVNGSQDSRTMTSHGSALLSLPYVHSQANLNNTYFDHTNIILYDVLGIINSLAPFDIFWSTMLDVHKIGIPAQITLISEYWIGTKVLGNSHWIYPPSIF